jgi:hypothetical protein
MVAEGTGLAAINLAMSGFPLSGIPLQVETVLEETTVAPYLAVIGVSRSDVLADRYALRPLSACSAAIRALEGATVWARVCGERVMWQAARALLGVDPHRLRRRLLGLEVAPLLPERTARCTRSVVERNAEDLVLCESGGILRTRAAVPPLRRRPSSGGTALDARAMAVLGFVRTALQKRGVGLRVAVLPEWTADRADGIVLEALRTSGFQVYDFTDAGADDFYDPVHVNQAGGLALTTRLVQALSHDEHGLIGIRVGRPGDPEPVGR